LKRKQSLKDILKNKREKSGYKLDKNESKVENKYDSYYGRDINKSYGVSPVLTKYYKNGIASGQGSLKEMKTGYSFTRY
jgi:hypothetical protein